MVQRVRVALASGNHAIAFVVVVMDDPITVLVVYCLSLKISFAFAFTSSYSHSPPFSPHLYSFSPDQPNSLIVPKHGGDQPLSCHSPGAISPEILNYRQSEMGSPENPNWVFDYGYMEDIPGPGGDLLSLDQPNFCWPSHSLTTPPPDFSEELDDLNGNQDGFKESGFRKRLRPGSSNSSGSKACREKVRRDRLNDRFLELDSIIVPGRPAKMDKAAILSDAVRMLSQLRGEAQKLRESNENLLEKINELKAEKNELHDEKQRLKLEKDNIEQRVKALSSPHGFLPHPATLPAPFPAPGQVLGSKMMPFIGYPGVSMWQFLPPAAVDTSQDHVLRPPVA